MTESSDVLQIRLIDAVTGWYYARKRYMRPKGASTDEADLDRCTAELFRAYTAWRSALKRENRKGAQFDRGTLRNVGVKRGKKSEEELA